MVRRERRARDGPSGRRMPWRRVGVGIARRDPSRRDGIGREGGRGAGGRASPPRARPRCVRRGSRRTSGRRGFVRPGRGPSGARRASSRPWKRSRTTRGPQPDRASGRKRRSSPKRHRQPPRSPRGDIATKEWTSHAPTRARRATHPEGNAERDRVPRKLTGSRNAGVHHVRKRPKHRWGGWPRTVPASSRRGVYLTLDEGRATPQSDHTRAHYPLPPSHPLSRLSPPLS